MLKLNTLTINDIRAHAPCYDPDRYAPEGWSGTILDILEHENIPPEDRIWVACYIEDALPDSVLRLFAARVARNALAGQPHVDPRSWNATVVAEMYAYGLASHAELDAAREAAMSAAWSAARDAAWEAAWYVARDAAWYVARHAVRKWQVKELVRTIEEWED